MNRLVLAAREAHRRWSIMRGPASSISGDTKVVVDKQAWYGLADAMQALFEAARDDKPDPYEFEVRVERANQELKWGGPEHDDQHSPSDWVDILQERLDLAEAKIGAYDSPESYESLLQFRWRITQLEALCRATRQSFDRRI